MFRRFVIRVRHVLAVGTAFLRVPASVPWAFGRPSFSWPALAWSVAIFAASLFPCSAIFGVPPARALVVWYPNGLLLAAMLSTPSRYWPGLLSGAYAGLFVLKAQRGLSFPDVVVFPAILSFAFAISASALRRAGVDPLLRDRRSVLLLMLFGPGLLSVIIDGTWAVLVASFGWRSHPLPWHARMMAGMIAVMIITPTLSWLFSGGLAKLRGATRARWLEAASLMFGLVVLWMVLVEVLPSRQADLPAILYLPFPFLLWAACRFGTGGAGVALLAVLLGMVMQARTGRGEFAWHTASQAVLTIQLAMIVLAIPTLLLAAVIQEQQAAERRVRERDHLLTTTLDSLSAQIIVLDRAGLVRYATPAWDAYVQWVSGDPAASGLGVSYLDVCRQAPRLASGDRDAWAAIESVLDGRAPHASVEYESYPRPDMAGAAWLLLHADALPADRGGVVISLLDITARREIERALEASEVRLKRAMDAARMGEWESDLATGRIWWSDNLYRLMDLPLGCVTDYESFRRVLHHNAFGEDHVRRRAFIERGGYQEWALQFVRGDGTTFWGECRGERVPGTDIVVGMTVDVSARHEAEERLRHALLDVQRLRDQLQAENVYLHEELSESDQFGDGGIVVNSTAMRAVLGQAAEVAPTLTPVLITGETGTGKEVLARAIHGMSPRKDRPLVRVSCSALPPTLIESELFGHERGAFTGAIGRRVGRFELADGGTLFLDEIGELPLELQPKLLRALQESEFERVGGSKTVRVSVRIIAATNRDLAASVRAGAFRADLYYRLNVFPIHVPPLRERTDAIGALAAAALQRASKRVGRSFDRIPPDVVRSLEAYAWPGNVRELHNVIERAALLSRGRTLRLPEGWDMIAEGSLEAAAPGQAASHETARDGQPLLPLQELERRHIIRVLEHTRWRIDGPRGAAVVLQVNPSTLRSRMTKLGILATGRGGGPLTSSANGGL